MPFRQKKNKTEDIVATATELLWKSKVNGNCALKTALRWRFWNTAVQKDVTFLFLLFTTFSEKNYRKFRQTFCTTKNDTAGVKRQIKASSFGPLPPENHIPVRPSCLGTVGKYLHDGKFTFDQMNNSKPLLEKRTYISYVSG